MCVSIIEYVAKKKEISPMQAAISAYFAAVGREGGKQGGRWKGMTAEQRKAAMRPVIDARLAKQRRAS
jgi:hypothetical protein